MLGHTIGAEEQGIIAMPAPYSKDFRQKAIAAVERGNQKIEVSRMFNISRNTLDQWLKRQEETASMPSNRASVPIE